MEYMESKIQDLIQGGIDEQNEPPQTPDAFTKWVGATTFAEAVSVTLRTKAQDEDKIAEMFEQVKRLSKERNEAFSALNQIEVILGLGDGSKKSVRGVDALKQSKP